MYIGLLTELTLLCILTWHQSLLPHSLPPSHQPAQQQFSVDLAGMFMKLILKNEVIRDSSCPCSGINPQLVPRIQGFSVSEIQHVHFTNSRSYNTVVFTIKETVHTSGPMQLKALLFKDQCIRNDRSISFLLLLPNCSLSCLPAASSAGVCVFSRPTPHHCHLNVCQSF